MESSFIHLRFHPSKTDSIPTTCRVSGEDEDVLPTLEKLAISQQNCLANKWSHSCVACLLSGAVGGAEETQISSLGGIREGFSDAVAFELSFRGWGEVEAAALGEGCACRGIEVRLEESSSWLRKPVHGRCSEGYTPLSLWMFCLHLVTGAS